MKSTAQFSITRNGEPIHGVAIGSISSTQPIPVDVNELQAYGFEVERREPDTDYSVWIGDIQLGVTSAPDHSSSTRLGIPRGHQVLWEDATYFEGARGLVWSRLSSRRRDGSEKWETRAILSVVVTSTKLSQDRYTAMFEQLRSLAAGLVLDLVSKTLRSLQLIVGSERGSAPSSAIELRILESVWPIVARELNAIAMEPAETLRLNLNTRNCWGSERFGARSLALLAAQGIDPRQRSTAIPFRTQVEEISKGTDIHEHCVIRGFVDLLYDRALECREDIRRHIKGIVRDRPWRDRPTSTQLSLYDLEDKPRLRQLNRRLRVADLLVHQMRRARRIEPIARVSPALDLSLTPIFANIEPYRRIRHELIRYLRTGLVVLEPGLDERVKSTSRLYEQWVFLQLASGLRWAGLECFRQQGLLRSTRMFRFTLDLDRGARASFASPDGRIVVLRYEPWILPEESARQNRDSVFRGRSGKAAWSPDVLLEIQTGEEAAGKPPEIDYAVILDCKYARSINDDHWRDTDKYLEIKSTATRRQVVRQHWLAFPGTLGEHDNEIEIRDPSVKWTTAGPNCPKTETVQGTLLLSPPTTVHKSIGEPGWIVRPESSTCSFISGLLRYVGISIKERDLSVHNV